VEFVAYPDVSNSDLMSALFHEQHMASGREFLVSRSFDSSISGQELFEVLERYAPTSWEKRASVFLGSWMIVCHSETLDMGASFTVHSNNVWVNLSTHSYGDAEAFMDAMEEGLPPVGNVEDLDKIDVRFWMLGGSNPTSQVRTLETFHWDDVERNYPGQVKGQLDDLMKMPPPQVGGKLILWHGHPGGGKTSAIKTLVDSWREWANAEYVVDPEAFFGHASYMLSVLNRGTTNGLSAEDDKWRVIIVEDAGQFVHKDADATTGQAFSRLLNMTDGMIGQGLKVIVLITTNRPLNEMHEALRRPGRCIANIEFSKFSAKEANEWLGLGRAATTSEMSLAELYETQKVTQIKTKKESASVGQYI
jgi:ATPase family associated with various cellular activities (AAA)